MPSLSASIIEIPDITATDRRAMFQLYQRYYGGTSEEVFFSDLADKDYALLLRDDEDQVGGFSTLALLDDDTPHAMRALFSGDTIVDRAFWGQQQLAFNWIRFAGQLKAQHPEVPLYWFLIVKGHRTYRYLSTFSIDYYPHHANPTPPATNDLMTRLARARFGGHFDAGSGLVKFPSARGHLQPEWARVPPQDAHKPEVRYFLERNPNYVSGDELVCLTELTLSNLRPLAKRIFLQGMAGPPVSQGGA